MNASTTYSEIFICFLDNCKINTKNLPQTDEGKYQMIHNACLHYNNKMDENEVELTCDDTTEEVNVKLDGSRLLILAYCLKLIYEENQLTSFIDRFSLFQKEIGFKNYKDQLNGKQNMVDRVDAKLLELISNIEEKTIM